MWITKCNKCGKESRYEDDNMITMSYKYYRKDPNTYSFDLCLDCFKEFKHDFMGGLEDGNE